MPFTNNSEGGVSGNTPTTTDGGSGDNWTAVTRNGDSVLEYSSAQAAHGSLSYRYGTRATSNVCSLDWSFGSSAAEWFGRIYLRLDVSDVTATTRLMRIRSTSSGTIACWILITTGEQIQIRPHDLGAAVWTSTTTLSADTWYRLEWRYAVDGTTTGVMQIRLYAGDSTSALEDSGSINVTAAAAISAFQFTQYGSATGSTNSPTSTGHVYLDDISAFDTTWPGPAISGGAYGSGVYGSGVYGGAAGGGEVTGSSALTVTFAALTAAQVTRLAAGTAPITFGASTSAARLVSGAASREVTFGATTSARRVVSAASSATWTVGATTAARKTAYAAAETPIVLGAATSGVRTVHASNVLPVVFTAETSGQVVGAIEGRSQSTYTLGAATSGVVTRHGAASLTVTFNATSSGVRTAYGSTLLPVVFGATTTAATEAVTGAASATFTFGATTTAAVTRYGAASLPVTFGAATSAVRTAYAAALLELVLAAAADAHKIGYGTLELPIVFGATTTPAGDAPIAADVGITGADDGVTIIDPLTDTELIVATGVTVVSITDA